MRDFAKDDAVDSVMGCLPRAFADIWVLLACKSFRTSTPACLLAKLQASEDRVLVHLMGGEAFQSNCLLLSTASISNRVRSLESSSIKLSLSSLVSSLSDDDPGCSLASKALSTISERFLSEPRGCGRSIS